jgi:hypothetical protein
MNAKNKAIAKKVTELGNLNWAQIINTAIAPRNRNIAGVPATSFTRMS